MITFPRIRFALLALALVALPACGDHRDPLSPVAPASAVTLARSGDLLSGPVSGTLPDGVTTYRATFALDRFTVRDGQLVGVYSLDGALYDATETVVGSISEEIFVATSASATCEELDLDTAPIQFSVAGYTAEIYEGGPLFNLTISPNSGRYTILLCQVADQLERGNLQAAAGLITQVMLLVAG